MNKNFNDEINSWVASQLEACTRCGICAEACPFYNANGNIELTPIWKIEPLRRAYEQQFTLLGRLKTRLGFSKPLSEADLQHWRDLNFTGCSTCGRCSMACPMGISVGLLMHNMRAGLAHAGVLPENLTRMAATVAENDNVFGYPNYERAGWVDYMADAPDDYFQRPQAEVVYFTGCVSAFSPKTQRIAESFVRLLALAEVDFTLLGENEVCCGFPLKAAGLEREAKALIEKNIEAITETGAHTIVFTCPACRLMWLREYADRLPAVRPLHATELLTELIEAGKLKFNPIETTVTYHDPCDLARNGGVYDAPRQVLQAIPGLRLIEVDDRREGGLCCGGGGDVEMVAPDQVNKVARDTVTKFNATGADILVTACPQCVRVLDRGVQARKYAMKVLDVTDLVAQAAGVG